MSHRFRLQLVRVECLNEQLREVGKDEMRLFPFAVSRKGQFFSPGYRSLGSYGGGDVRSDDGSFPMTLVETELEDDGLQVLFFGWLVEEDSGGVGEARNAIEQQFRSRFQARSQELLALNVPRECPTATTCIQGASGPTRRNSNSDSRSAATSPLLDPLTRLLDLLQGLAFQRFSRARE